MDRQREASAYILEEYNYYNQPFRRLMRTSITAGPSRNQGPNGA